MAGTATGCRVGADMYQTCFGPTEGGRAQSLDGSFLDAREQQSALCRIKVGGNLAAPCGGGMDMQKVKARARRTQLRRRGILCGSQHLPWYGAARMPGLAACRDANYPGPALGPKPRCSPQVSSKWVRHGGLAMFSVGTAGTELAAEANSASGRDVRRRLCVR